MKLKVVCAALSLIAQLTLNAASACTISQSMDAKLPMNSVEIPNDARVKIAEMMIEARKWPVADIRGVILANAYFREKNPKVLIRQRAAKLEAYLLQLGIKKENIWIEPHLLTDAMVRERDGHLRIEQMSVIFYPICEGGCGRLCNDPRVTPDTKLIQ